MVRPISQQHPHHPLAAAMALALSGSGGAVPCCWQTPRCILFAMLVLVVASGCWANPVAAGPCAPTPLTSLYNFVEYFGPMVARPDLVPRSVIEFHNYWPATRTTAARLEGVCATAVDNGTGGAIVKFGGAC